MMIDNGHYVDMNPPLRRDLAAEQQNSDSMNGFLRLY